MSTATRPSPGPAHVRPDAPRDRIVAGTPALRRLNTAMLAAGLAAFALLYATQALLPDIGRTFGAGATVTSLTISVATGVLALTVLPMSALAERVGRARTITVALVVACLSVLASSVAPWLWALLVLRGVDGLALAGVVAVAVGHIGDEVHPEHAGTAIGVYVSGTTLGGLLGRLVPAGVTEFASWRWALVALAVVGALCTLAFTRLVPESRSAPRRDASLSSSWAPALRHLRDPGIVRLCLVAMLLMGGFVGTYNFLTYRLGEQPFGLSPSAVGLVFLAYLSGTVSSTVGARAASRFGRRAVVLASIATSLVGLAITLVDSLPAVLVGLVIFTTGFFGAHSVASGWTSARAATDKSHAAALYLMAYYLGSSVGGALIGFAWTGGGWPATVTCVAACYVVAAVLGAGIRPVTAVRAR